MKKIFFSYVFLIILLSSIAIIVFKFNPDFSKNNNLNSVKCSDLNYEESLNIHPNKFKSIKLNLKILDQRKWSQLLLEDEIQAKATQLKFSSSNTVYTNRKRVKASIEVNINTNFKCTLLANIRPHGDLKDHRSSNGLPSININVTDGHLFGIVKFILFKPNTRNYDNEIFATTLLKELNFLAPRTANFEITYNKNSYKYIFQEKVEKEFIENNLKVENPLLKGDERFTFIDRQRFAEEKNIFNHNFKPINEKFILKDKNQQFVTEVGLSILNELALYYQGDVDEDDNFDFYSAGKKAGYEKNFVNFKSFDALVLSMNADHGLSPGNRRIYFDPIFKQFHPIYYDGMARLLGKNNKYIKQIFVEGKDLLYKSEKNKIYRPGMFNGKALISGVEGAHNALELIKKIDEDVLREKLKINGVLISTNELKKTLNGISKNLILLKNLNINKIFKFKKNIIPSIYIKNNFNYIESLKKTPFKENLTRRLVFYSNNKDEFISCNILNENCEILKIKKKNISKLIAQTYTDKENNKLIFLGKKKNNSPLKGWLGQKKNNFLNEFSNYKNNHSDFKIKKIGNIDIQINENLKTISINKNNGSGRVIFFDGALKDWAINFKDNMKFNNFKIKERRDKNSLTGCINFIDIYVKNLSITTNNASCEDAINFIRSKGDISNITSNNSKGDALDADFSKLKFNSIVINNSLNDCIDFSHGEYELGTIRLNNCGDKALSVGENSNVKAKDFKATNVNIGIAAKDFSMVKVDKSIIDGSKTCYESYNKKQEFSGAYLLVNDSKCKNSEQESYKDNFSIIKYGDL